MNIIYSREPDLSVEEFQSILISSTLAERRPIEDRDRLNNMLRHSNIIITARDNKQIVGVSRAITDFSYCCYLSDLAVDAKYQNKGIGKFLIEETKKAASSNATIILIASPAAEHYYSKIGMEEVKNCWKSPALS